MFARKNILRQPKVFSPPKERNNNSHFSKLVFIVGILLIIFGAVIYTLFYSPIFKIKNIIISGSNSEMLTKEIEKIKGENIILFKSKEIEEEIIKNFPSAVNVQIIRGLPDTIKIQWEDHIPKIIWATSGKQYLVDGRGLVYKETDEITLPQVMDNKNLSVSLGDFVVSENFVNFVIDTSGQFEPMFGFKIIHFEINETMFQVDAITDQGWKIIFDTTRPVKNELSDLQKFLESHKDELKEYVDLRIEGKVFFQ